MAFSKIILLKCYDSIYIMNELPWIRPENYNIKITYN